MIIDYEITETTAKRLERCIELGIEPAVSEGETAAGEDLPY